MKLFNYSTLLKIVFLTIIIVNNKLCIAQNDLNLEIENNYKKATLLSVACPGLGQIYNKKIWKVPIIYTAMGVSAYLMNKHNKKYKNYRTAYLNRIDSDINTNDNFDNYSDNNLLTLKDYHQNSRDLSTLLFLLVYVLNIVDASVDAHLTNYNINNNLSLYLNSIDSEAKLNSLNISVAYKF